MAHPLVSCLMVTRNRRSMAARAVRCFAEQTWPTKELVIVDDGDEDYEPILAPYRRDLVIAYHRIPCKPGQHLGALRNLSLELARGDHCMQWDDDEWYHPQRIAAQMGALVRQKLDAVLLTWTLMHLDEPTFRHRPYRASCGRGTPGTVLHERSAVRYPNLERAEDSVYLASLARVMRVGTMRAPHSHLFIRCFHGANTWDRAHFLKRLHRTPRDMLHYAWAGWCKRDVFSHPAFRLDTEERDAFAQFYSMSRVLGLFAPHDRSVLDAA